MTLAASLALPVMGELCFSGAEAAGIALSESSSGSGWSSGTAVEQRGAWSGTLWPAHHALGPQASCSLERGFAAQLAATVGQAGAAAGASSQQPWQLLSAQPAAGMQQPFLPATQQMMTGGWQHGSGNGSTSAAFAALQQHQAAQRQQQQQPSPFQAPSTAAPTAAVAAATAATAAAADPWDCGLDLVVANCSAPLAPADDGLALQLTDEGMAALLAPFEDWPCLLQPAAPLSPGPQQQFAAGAATAAGSAATSSGAAPSDGAGGKARRRTGGRPRLHHPKAPAAAAAAAAAAGGSAPGEAAGSAGTGAAAAGVVPYKKSGRGPKPKYLFGTQEEAADARRERNRKAALDSYYRKKEHAQRLRGEIAALQAENSTLQQLLHDMSITGLCPLPEASNDGINTWLQLNRGGSHGV